MLNLNSKSVIDMGHLVKKLLNRLRPAVSRQRALKIAQKQCSPPINTFRIYDKKPSEWRIYGVNGDEDFWYVERSGGWGALCTSHAIIISKKTGRVIYNGSAHNDG